MTRSYVAKILVAAILPFGVLLGSGIALYDALQNSQMIGDQITRGQAVITNAHSLTLKVVDAESGERGYVITGKDSFLVPFEQALTGFRITEERLQQLVAGQPGQLARLEQASTIFQQWVNDVAKPVIAEHRRGGNPEAIISEGYGKQLIDSFRTTIADFTTEASESLQMAQQESLAIAQRARQIAFLGLSTAVGIFILLWLNLIHRTSTAIRGITHAAESFMAGRDGHRAPVLGKDEFATMAQAFNRMAEKLEQQHKSEVEARKHLTERVEKLVADRTSELLAMNDMVELLQSCQQLEEAIQVTRSLLPDLFPGTIGDLLVRQDDEEDLEVVVRWGEERDESIIETYRDRDCWALRRGRIHHADVSLDHSALVCTHVHEVAGHHICIPLTAQGNTFGVLHIGFEARDEREKEARSQYAANVADQLSISFANLTLRESLHQQSVRDPLTGLYNRRYLEETIERELGRSAREKRPLSVIMLDLDYFKDINDEYGHTVGDKVLVKVAELLNHNIRGEDLICRFGGEEFTIIMPNAGSDAAADRAEELRQAISGCQIDCGEDIFLQVTASFGVATFPEDGEGSGLLTSADDALYQAKETGRNRIVRFRQMVAA